MSVIKVPPSPGLCRPCPCLPPITWSMIQRGAAEEESAAEASSSSSSSTQGCYLRPTAEEERTQVKTALFLMLLMLMLLLMCRYVVAVVGVPT